MAKTSDLKMIRISRKVGDKLVRHIKSHNKNNAMHLNAGRFVDEAILRHIANTQPGQ